MSPGGNSSDPAARARSLANLRPPPPAPPGNLRALGVTDDLLERLLAEVPDDDRELLGALAEVAPLRDRDGKLPAADVVAVEQAAEALRRARVARGLERQRERESEAARRGSPQRAADARLADAQRHAVVCEGELRAALVAVLLGGPAPRARTGGDLAVTADGLARARMTRASRAEVEGYLAGMDDGYDGRYDLPRDGPPSADDELAVDDAGAGGGAG